MFFLYFSFFIGVQIMISFTGKDYIFDLNGLKESEIEEILSILTFSRIKFEFENKILKAEGLHIMSLGSPKIKKLLLSIKI